MTHSAHSVLSFAEMLPSRLAIVNRGVDAFSADLHTLIAAESPDVRAAVGSCLDLLQRGGKRMRGVLAVTGYQIGNGEDMETIGRAAGAIEAIHAHLLVMDDIQDRAETRRGDKAAHTYLRDYFTKNSGACDPAHVGSGMAQNAGQIIQNKAQATLLGLAVPDSRKVRAGIVLNDHLAYTGIGQIRDILPADYTSFDAAAILETARLKTAQYSVAMPLQVGAALAGAPAHELHHFDRYALNMGLAFQLRDDVLGLFADEQTTGKPQKSDVMEGKKTWIMATALERAGDDRHVLLGALGNTALKNDEFDHCLFIVRKTGALDEAHALISQYTESAIAELDAVPASWPEEPVQFLRSIAVYGAQRQT